MKTVSFFYSIFCFQTKVYEDENDFERTVSSVVLFKQSDIFFALPRKYLVSSGCPKSHFTLVSVHAVTNLKLLTIVYYL